jgi:hypothetical protein
MFSSCNVVFAILFHNAAFQIAIKNTVFFLKEYSIHPIYSLGCWRYPERQEGASVSGRREREVMGYALRKEWLRNCNWQRVICPE